ncbi:alkaline phosphatase family protein [Conexibacter sp. SYSU D00693]|uniref:alkaline phosphatase family protein n=1 Tax=Conexibacter sp. SYSU D00693 TaxID=2812560 RepID=UPI00196B0C80|nr:alkaline phosphatase family protein [Conexibacter sp. SYSU D00693]
MLRVGLLALVLLVLAAPARAQAPALDVPPGTSAAKVLVIGTDGTRFDLVQRLMDAGEAPHLRALAQDGFALPSVLQYRPPGALTLSEVGWTTIATGVWPAKHGVRGYALNNDPGQATKNGHLDLLSRLERERPRLSTFLASNWANLGLHRNGGPIFGDAVDAGFAIAAPDDVEGWDAADQEVADVAARQLRERGPDASVVYFGVVDEAAHLVGSATPRYRQAIRDLDRRVGQLLDAIRARPTYAGEQWTVLVTTDHGQQDLAAPSAFSHGGGSDLERTSFVLASGFGVPRVPARPLWVVDLAPSVFVRLGVAVERAWDLDGRAFTTAPAVPAPTAAVRRRGRTLRITVRAPAGAPALRSVAVRGGAARASRRVRAADGARRVRLTVRLGRPAPALVRVTTTDTTGAATATTVRVAGRSAARGRR